MVVIHYDTISFDPMMLIADLKRARDMKLMNCVWQLGDNTASLTNKFSVKKYSDDLKTLKILCESVNKDDKLNWNVAADANLSQVEKLSLDLVGIEINK